MLGIDWDFHPDAYVYVIDFDAYAQGWETIPNNLYFHISKWFKGSAWLLIELNILVFALTNSIGVRWIIERSKALRLSKKTAASLILLFILQPYRAHLAVHVLKDTLIIAALLFFILMTVRKSFWAFVLLIMLRLSSVVYVIATLRRRVMAVVFLAMFTGLLIMPTELLEFLTARNEAEMGGREFNSVPSFSGYGIAGTFIRALVWPILLLTGSFLALSPSVFYIPLAAELTLGRLLQWKIRIGSFAIVSVALSLAVVASLITSFTAFIRYAYPLVALMPFLMLLRHEESK